MNIVTPELGLLFWTSLIFLIALVLLSRFAWKPILKSINDRTKSIEDALQAAELAKTEMKALGAENERLIMEARAERDTMLLEAKRVREEMLAKAKVDADAISKRELEQARIAITQEKNAALAEVKNIAAELSISIAEKIMKNQLGSKEAQESLAKEYLASVKLN